jgi:hypothetical protein
MFTQYRTNIFRVQYEFTADGFYTDFVNGPGDAIVADNTRLVLRQSPPLIITLNGSQPVLHWDDPNVQLLSATNVSGPYVLVPGATSPYPVPPGSTQQFFRSVFRAVP